MRKGEKERDSEQLQGRLMKLRIQRVSVGFVREDWLPLYEGCKKS